jgi:hypothetical protein
MIDSTSLQQQIGLTICVWFVIVTILLIAATWTATDREASRQGARKTWADLPDDLTQSPSASPSPALHFSDGYGGRLCRDSSSHSNSDLAEAELQAMEGTLQRVDYPHQELRIVGQGRVWYFAVDSNCQLWFNDKPAILRCFHPLDSVKVVFAHGEPKSVIRAMYAWEKQPA